MLSGLWVPSPSVTTPAARAGTDDRPWNTPSSRAFQIVDVDLRIATDDVGLLEEFESIFGGSQTADRPPRASFQATVLAAEAGADHGRLSVQGDALADPASFLLGFASPTIPLRALPNPGSDGAVLVGLEGDDQPLFAFRGDECLFRKVPRWRRIVAHFLFLRLLRLRTDLIFFHAASVGIGGQGLLLMGPKGGGKSTVSAALAARGHNFLGDETAAYQPSSRLLFPFRRPLGIKPGPRSALIDRSLGQMGPRPDEEGILRIPIEALCPVPEAHPVPLRAVCFLDGFAASPELLSSPGGRDELSRMQPMASSLGQGATSCVFEMIRLLGGASCYRLRLGDPDETAALLEEVFTRS
jgi:hypothetical protein